MKQPFEYHMIQNFDESTVNEIVEYAKKTELITSLFLANPICFCLNYAIGGPILTLIAYLINFTFLFYWLGLISIIAIIVLILLLLCLFFGNLSKLIVRRYLKKSKELYISEKEIRIKNKRVKLDAIKTYRSSHPKYFFLQSYPYTFIIQKDQLPKNIYQILIEKFPESDDHMIENIKKKYYEKKQKNK